MQLQPFSGLSREEVERLLSYVPFFRQVQQQDLQQYHLLLAFAKVSVFAAGEQMLEYGSEDQWFYFLLRGELEVYRTKANQQPFLLNRVQAGEIFGELSLLLNRTRTADIKVADNCRQAIVFGLDFNIFRKLNDFAMINRESKLAFYRNITHHLRWKLDNYRNLHPSNPLADKHRQIKVLSLPKGGVEELIAVHDQAVTLAKLLADWNPVLENAAS